MELKQKRLDQNKNRELIAKVKFWFGKEYPIFNTLDYEIETKGDFVYIYKR